MEKRIALLCAAFAAAVMVSAPVASAQTIDFGNLVGSNFDPYAGSMEDGFTIAPISGNWKEGHVFGNPVPSIFDDTGGGLVRVTGGVFSFASVDLGTSDFSQGAELDYLIEGFLGGGTQFSFGGQLNGGFFFETIGSVSGAAIDTLEISFTSINNGFDMNIDNIVLRAAPIPAPAALPAGIALLGMLGLRRRRRAG